MDLPGYGYAEVPEQMRAHWQALLGRYLLTRAVLRGIVLLMDIRHPMKDLDIRMLECCAERQLPAHILLTKADKLSRGAAGKQLQAVRGELANWHAPFSVQMFSSLKRKGCPRWWRNWISGWWRMLAELSLWILALLALVGIVAGFVDTLAGGGGMLTIPSLLLAGLPPDAALATNKLQGSCGTLLATGYFVKRGQIRFCCLLPGIAACALGAACGTLTVQYLPKEALQQALPLLLAVVALIFIFMPSLGSVAREARLPYGKFALAAALPIGFYDGFLGPGTGSFFMLALISLRGYTLQNATIEAKAYNATTNLVSLLVFLIGGKIVWLAGVAMAVGQILGARLAAGLIISKGNRLIRPAVIAMSLIMSAVLAHRYWF